MPERSVIVAAARRWIGTPYHHQGSLRGAGCDCLGLVRGVWRDLYGTGARDAAALYARLGRGGRPPSTLLAAARRHLRRKAAGGRLVPGDALVFRLRPQTPSPSMSPSSPVPYRHDPRAVARRGARGRRSRPAGRKSRRSRPFPFRSSHPTRRADPWRPSSSARPARRSARPSAARSAAFIGGAVGAIGGAVVDSLLVRTLTPRRSSNPQLSDPAHHECGRERRAAQAVGAHAPRRQRHLVHAVQHLHDASQANGSGKGALFAAVQDHRHPLHAELRGRLLRGRRLRQPRPRLGRRQPARSQPVSPTRSTTGPRAQEPDSFIESVEGAGNVPAYRGTCYLVFENMLLDDVRQPHAADHRRDHPALGASRTPTTSSSHAAKRGVPATGRRRVRARHARVPVLRRLRELVSRRTSTSMTGPARLLRLDGRTRRRAARPREAVSLVVSWFGTDLRAGNCQITPKVETREQDREAGRLGGRRLHPRHRAGGQPDQPRPRSIRRASPDEHRRQATPVPAFGGTPSDATVTQAIQYMNGQGIRVMFYPFIMMDIPVGQRPAGPAWRHGTGGLSPGAGASPAIPARRQAGTVDKTSHGRKRRSPPSSRNTA